MEQPQDPLFVEMATWNPLDANDRAKYKDATVQQILRRNPDAARAQYDFPAGGRRRRRGSQTGMTVPKYPLSALVALGASLETVRLAIQANPDALKSQTHHHYRSNVLHTACLCRTVDVKVLQYIHAQYPQGIRETTSFVYLPLHNACQAGAPLPVLQFLVEAYPEALMSMNKLGDTPLRTAQRNEQTLPEVLEYLEQETDRVFGQNEEVKEQVQARQSWGGARDVLKAAATTAISSSSWHNHNHNKDEADLGTSSPSSSMEFSMTNDNHEDEPSMMLSMEGSNLNHHGSLPDLQGMTPEDNHSEHLTTIANL